METQVSTSAASHSHMPSSSGRGYKFSHRSVSYVSCFHLRGCVDVAECMKVTSVVPATLFAKRACCSNKHSELETLTAVSSLSSCVYLCVRFVHTALGLSSAL